MNSYAILKTTHVIFAAVLLGGGMSLFLYCLWIYYQSNLTATKQALLLTLKINVNIIAIVGLLQIITGFFLIYLKLSHFTMRWIVDVIISNSVALLSWLIGLFILGRCQLLDDKQWHYYFFSWIILCVVVMISLILVYYFMTDPMLISHSTTLQYVPHHSELTID